MNQNELKDKLHYCPKTGVFTHLLTHRNTKAGDIAGSVDPSRGNYRRIHISKGKYVSAHRLAFLYMWGYIPDGEIDHIDHNPDNNAWENLRVVSHKENGKNQKKYVTNSTGITGVTLRPNGKWRSRIYHEGKHIHLGIFPTKEEAISARKDAEAEYQFHRNHGT